MTSKNFNRYVSSRFDLMLKGNMGVFNSRLINKLDFAAPFLNFKFKLLNEHNKLRPYLYAGPGFLADNKKSGLNYNIGLGTKYRINSGIALYFDCGYISGINIHDQGGKVKDNFWKATIGIEFSFKKKYQTDGDGLPDRIDKCPDTPPGVPVDENGCPLDTDGDGIVDYLDNCPKNVGLTSLKGCPDSDGDGIADKDDRCPNTQKGSKTDSFGCPLDTDKDGIADEEDKCPTIAGSKANQGCPEVEAVEVAQPFSDRDNDGIPDEDDRCPTIPGSSSNNGCPVTSSGLAVDNTKNGSDQDKILRKATGGFTYTKKIRSLEDGFIRVVIKADGSTSQVRAMIRNSEREEQQVQVNKDTTTIFIIPNIEFYDSVTVRPSYNKSDFTLTPTPVNAKETQKMNLTMGNEWLWKVRAESKEPHTSIITIEIEGITPQGLNQIAIRQIPIEIAILPPPIPPDPLTTWEHILKWVGGKIEYVLSAFITALVGYLVKRIFEKKKE